MVDVENLKVGPTPLGGVGLGLRAWLDFRSWLGAPVQSIVCTALSSCPDGWDSRRISTRLWGTAEWDLCLECCVRVQWSLLG